MLVRFLRFLHSGSIRVLSSYTKEKQSEVYHCWFIYWQLYRTIRKQCLVWNHFKCCTKASFSKFISNWIESKWWLIDPRELNHALKKIKFSVILGFQRLAQRNYPSLKKSWNVAKYWSKYYLKIYIYIYKICTFNKDKRGNMVLPIIF